MKRAVFAPTPEAAQVVIALQGVMVRKVVNTGAVCLNAPLIAKPIRKFHKVPLYKTSAEKTIELVLSAGLANNFSQGFSEYESSQVGFFRDVDKSLPCCVGSGTGWGQP
jgi:hypothetical protein